MTTTMTTATVLARIARRGVRSMVHRQECRYARAAELRGHAMTITAGEAEGVLIACRTCLAEHGGASGLGTFRL